MKKRKTARSDFYQFYAKEIGASEERVQFNVAKKRSPLLRILGALFVGLLAASAWFGYLFFSERLGGSSDPVLLTVKGPATVESGALAEYVIEYHHIGSVSVPDVSLFAEYPIGFTLIESEPMPANTKKNFWNIGTLEPGKKGTIRLSGTLTGFAAEEREALFRLQYVHPAYRSSFRIEKSVKTIMGQPRVERLDISGPQTINAGSTGTLTIRYQDVSRLGNPENVILKLTLPEGLLVESSDPTVSDKGKNEWNGFALSKSVRPDREGGILSVTLKGDDTIKGTYDILAQLVLRDSGGDALLLEQRHSVIVLRSDLVLSLETPKGSVISLSRGAKHPLSLVVENNGNTTFRDVEVRMQVESPLIDGEASTFDRGELHDTVVIWRATGVEELAELSSGERVTLPVTLALRDEVGDEEAVRIALDARINEREEQDGQTITDPLDVEGPRLSLPVLSDARLRAFVRDVTDISTEAERAFRIYLGVTNTLHDLDDLTVSATLPVGVKWKRINSRSAGDITYDESNRRVVWALNTLPASVRRIDGSFDIAVSSGRASSGEHLVTDLLFTSKDRAVGEIIEQRIAGLTALETE